MTKTPMPEENLDPNATRVHLGFGGWNVKGGLATAPNNPDLPAVPVLILSERAGDKTSVCIFFHTPEAMLAVQSAFAGIVEQLTGSGESSH